MDGKPRGTRGVPIHDLRGAVGEGFGETSPVEWGAAHAVAAGESLFPNFLIGIVTIAFLSGALKLVKQQNHECNHRR